MRQRYLKTSDIYEKSGEEDQIIYDDAKEKWLSLLIVTTPIMNIQRTALIIGAMTLCVVMNAQEKDTLTIAVCGDIMMGTTYPMERLPENDGREIFKDVAQALMSADLTLGNHEGTLCDGGICNKKGGKYSYAFRTPTSYAERLSEVGFDYMSLANNHSNDFGEFGMTSTELALESWGIAYSGVSGRKEWAVVERDGIRYGICAFGHNSYTLKHTNLKKVKEILDILKEKSDIIVVSFHGGAEGADMAHLPYGTETYLGENRGDLRTFAHFCIDNGASVVYGHGPHVTRCIEVYNGKFIAYSLGNFATPYGISLDGIKGYAPVVTVRIDREGRFIDGKIHPFIQQYGQGPRADHRGKVTENIKNLSEADVPDSQAVIDLDGNIRINPEIRKSRITLPEVEFELPKVVLSI